MTGYRFRRRSFVAGIGGAFGLANLLRSMEAAAQGAGPPPRFLMMHWPMGTMRNQLIPTGTGTSYTTSSSFPGPGYIISPFNTPELRPRTIILHGLNMSGISGRGGGHEDGTVFATTGASSPGTRANGGETDDGCAGGPSWDQIFLKNVPALAKRDHTGTIVGRGYYNSICDARVGSYETSTRCLSYGYTKVSISSAVPGGSIMENIPLRPTLSPLTAFTDLFSGFMPGGGMLSLEETTRLLAERRSVLDGSLAALGRLETLAPADQRTMIDAQAEIIRGVERDLADPPPPGVACTVPSAPPASLKGQTGDHAPSDNPPTASVDDSPLHAQVGDAHAGILRAAFACDLIRVATFQWAPGTGQVSFKGPDPNAPNTIYRHRALGHQVGSSAFFQGPRPATSTFVWDGMVNINRWYFAQTAAIVDKFRLQVDPLDPMGGSLLDRTIIPMVTEVADPSHSRNGHAAVIFGGSRLGMVGGQYQSVTGIHNRLWTTIAQAYFGAGWSSALAGEVYVKNGATPIAGLWQAPA